MRRRRWRGSRRRIGGDGGDGGGAGQLRANEIGTFQGKTTLGKAVDRRVSAVRRRSPNWRQVGRTDRRTLVWRRGAEPKLFNDARSRDTRTRDASSHDARSRDARLRECTLVCCLLT